MNRGRPERASGPPGQAGREAGEKTGDGAGGRPCRRFWRPALQKSTRTLAVTVRPRRAKPKASDLSARRKSPAFSRPRFQLRFLFTCWPRPRLKVV